MSLLQNSNAISAPADTGIYPYQIANSLRFPGGTSSSLTNTSLSAGNRRTWTFSLWVKKNWLTSPVNEKSFFYGVSTGGATYAFWGFERHPTNSIYMDEFKFEETSGSTQSAFKITDGSNDAKFHDPSAFYHIVLAIDTTQSTATNRQKVWINGEAQTLDVAFQMAQDYEFSFINNGSAKISVLSWLDGLEDTQLADYIFLDGVAGTADTFGELYRGVWRPIEYSGSYGNEGYHLKFSDSSDIGKDYSGNNNHFTVNNLSAHDVLGDSPTFNDDSNGGNYCTYNPSVAQGGAQKLMTLREGNLLAESETNDKYHQTIGNMGVRTGKWYIEWYIKDAGYPSWAVGWHYGDQLKLFNGSSGQAATANMAYMGYFTGSTVYLTPFGNTGTNPTNPNHSSFTNQGAPTTGDVIMCAIDFDAGKGWWGINGVWGDVGSGTGNPATAANPSLTWTAADYPDHKFPFTLAWANPDTEIVMNTGSEGTFLGNLTAGGNADDTGYSNFKYDVPAGFLSLCTGNLPISDAINPAETSTGYPQKLFNAIAYSGDGGGSQTTGFQPDLVWVKRRNGAQGNGLWDSSRGTTKVLNSDSTSTEGTSSGLTAFNSTGYTMGNYYNQSGNTYVSWSWKCNGGTTSSETAGSINTTVQVNQNAGFSIVQYQGDGGSSNCTMAHGLGAKPALVFLKDRDSNGNNNQWQAWHHKLDTNGYFYLSSNSQAYTSTNGTVNVSANTTNLIGWQRTNTTGGSQTITENGDNFLMYIWAEIEGFSKFGRYEGNGSASSGPFCYTGFRPALVATKRIDGSGGWLIHDDARNPVNETDLIVQWNDDGAEFSGANDKISMLSNGFVMRSSNAGINGSGNDYIYAAWASNPLKYATAR